MHAQIAHALRDAVRSGRLSAGSPVPSSRALAQDLGVSRGVVVEAYDQLNAEGYLTTRAGSGTIVAPGVRAPAVEPEPRATPRVRFDLRPGCPDLTHFPREDWSRAARRVFRQLRPAQLDYGDPSGAPELRAALADYLGRVRGGVCRPGRVMVCSGFAQGLAIVGRTLARRGIRRIAMEDPSHPDQRRILSEAGLEPVPIPVDANGLRTDRLDEARLQAVLVAPAHQFPTGSVLDPDRRHALLAWAERRSAFIVEDDYDAEYRYDRSPIGALQGLAPDRVIYAGSTSKTLAPALRLGWLVVPAALAEAANETKRLADLGNAFVEQLVYAELLRMGALDRHLRRMRALYRARRDALLAALARCCPRWIPQGAAAGLHVMVLLPHGTDEARLVREAESRSVRIYPLGQYRFAHRPSPPAVVMGYACLSERELAEAISRIIALRAAR
jgi:GntR family transcriptional regulator/MocR family aminotransferase